MSSNSHSEEHSAEFHLETDLEAMEVMRPDSPEPPCPPVGRHRLQGRAANNRVGSQQLERSRQPTAAAGRRLEQVLPRRPELVRWQQEGPAEYRQRCNSVPTLEMRHQGSEFALSLRQIGDEYNQARSPTRTVAISGNRRRSSADFQSESAPERQSSWLLFSMSIMSNFVRRMSGASISPGQHQALSRGEAAASEDADDL